jgi:hypothetical protein
MNWFDEAQRSLYASWLLLIRDTGGYRHFAQSEAGFWRSFSAIVIIAPLYLYASTVHVELPDTTAPPPPSLAAAMAGLVLQWVGWPLAMVFIARFAGLQHALRPLHHRLQLVVGSGGRAPDAAPHPARPRPRRAGICHAAELAVVDADEVEAVGRRHRSAGPPVARR